MKIGFLTTSFPRHEGDLAGNFVFGMARALKRRGHTVKVLAPIPSDYEQSSGNIKWLEGIELIHVPYTLRRGGEKLFYDAGVPDNIATNPWLGLQVPGAILSLLYFTAKHSVGLDAIVSHWLVPSALLAGLSRSPGVRHLAISHSSDMHLLGKLPIARVIADRISRSADHIGFVTTRLRNQFLSTVSPSRRSIVSNRTSVVPMGVDLSELRTPRGRRDIRNELGIETYTALYVGRLVPIKGVDVLIDAIARNADMELVVAGGGPHRASLEARAYELGARVRFMGEVGPTKRAELFKACDVVVVPSKKLPSGRQEGLPLVIVEALGAGRPVVTTNVADTGKFVEGGNCGFTVSSEDAAEISKALRTLRDDQVLAKRLGNSGSLLAQGRDWSKLVENLEAIMKPSSNQ